MINKEFYIFEGRYKVVIGKRGGVKVYSVGYNKSYDNQMKVRGKGSDKFIPLKPTSDKGSYNYKVIDIKNHLLKGVMLLPIIDHIDRDNYLKDHLVIEQLPYIDGNYADYNYELDTQTLYKPLYLTQKSNGFLVKGYSVTLIDNGTYHSLGNTAWHKIEDRITITDLKQVDTKELEQIIVLLNDELITRTD